jgi:HEAT repeat protein
VSEGSRRNRRSRETRGAVVVVAGVVVALALMVWLNDAVDRAQPDVEPPASVVELPEAALEEVEISPLREAPAAKLEGAAVARAGLDLLGREPALDPADLDEMLNRALDIEAALEARIQAVRWLGRFGSDEAIDVLEHVLRAGSPARLMTEAAEALGSSKNADARRILETLLESENDAIVRGALRAVAARADADAIAILEAMLHDPNRSEALRVQAAASLGRLSTDQATASLRESLTQIGDSNLVPSILEALGEQSYSETEDFFRSILTDGEVDPEIKIAALEALSEAPPESAELLLEFASGASEPELRIAAVESLALLDEPEDAVAPMLDILDREPSPEVRAELYSALAIHNHQTHADAALDTLVPAILAEEELQTKLQGYRLVGAMLSVEPDPRLSEPFDEFMVDWLSGQAESGMGSFTRSLAIDALNLAGTDDAKRALDRLTHHDDPAVVAEAEKALRLQALRNEGASGN